jgi:prolipoprotein diacylglyceryltransferase
MALGRPGMAFALYLAYSGLIRLVMEFFRGDDRGPRIILFLRPTGLAALGILTMGLALRYFLMRPPRQANPRRLGGG